MPYDDSSTCEAFQTASMNDRHRERGLSRRSQPMWQCCGPDLPVFLSIVWLMNAGQSKVPKVRQCGTIQTSETIRMKRWGPVLDIMWKCQPPAQPAQHHRIQRRQPRNQKNHQQPFAWHVPNHRQPTYNDQLGNRHPSVGNDERVEDAKHPCSTQTESCSRLRRARTCGRRRGGPGALSSRLCHLARTSACCGRAAS